ncbi:MAG: uroporphyrinogen decarboxylase family protein [Chloroflexota bacterium]
MDSRERVTRAIEMTGPDRLPIYHTYLNGFSVRYGNRVSALLSRYEGDFGETGFAEPAEYGETIGAPQVDGWGAVWVRQSDEHKGLIVHHPLSDWAALDSYAFPDPLVIGDWRNVPETLTRGGHRKYVLVDGDTLYQRMFYLRGFDNLMLDLADGRSEVLYLRDRIVAFMLRKIEKWLDYEVDGFLFRDDWGTQQSLMISPRQWREVFKPSYRRIFAAVRAGGKHVWFHSDGYILAIIPDLLELGANVINPQADCIGVERLGAEFGGKVCFLGDIDRQHVLPYGTQAEVTAHVRRTVAALADFKGGYIGRGELAGDVPIENAEAMYATFASYRYQDDQLVSHLDS